MSVAFAAVTVGSLLFAAGASANTITVDTTADTTGGTPCTLRDAITSANTNSTPAGSNCTAGAAGNDDITITPTGTIQLASALPVIDTDMTITGPGAGSLTVRGELGTEAYRIFKITTPSSGPFPAVSLAGMKISNGAGGILDDTGGSLTLSGVTVSGNTATSTSATQSSASGAGIVNTAGAPVSISNSTVSGNTATATTTGPGTAGVFALAGGAAIHMTQGGNLTIDQSTIAGNTANANGNQTAATNGAIFNEGQTTIDSSTISGNTATATVSEAGGPGTANANGGAITQQGGNVNLSLSRVTISGNTAATVTSSASGNGFAAGGGILLNQTFADPLSGSVTGSTIAGNTVSATGPGFGSVDGANVDLSTNAGTTFTSRSTIFANGIGDVNCFQGRDGTFASQGYNLDTGTSCLGTPTTGDQSSVSSVNLALGPLQDNGGPTETMAPGLTSLAVDKGTRVGIGGVADQRGFTRNFDMNPTSGPPPDGDGTDVGAVEQSVSADPETKDFGSLQWGMTSATQAFLMHNHTGNTLPAGTVLGGTNAVDFQRSSDTCTNTAIPTDTDCTLDVAFHPVSPGDGDRNASLLFSVSPVQLVELTGTATGYTPAAINVAPTSHDFGSTQAGTPTGATQFVVSNTGLDTTGMLTTALTGASASEFGITSDTCASHTVAGGATCSVFVRMAPSSEGAKAATLTISGTGGPTSAILTGTATAPPPPPPATTSAPTGQRAAALKKCKKKKAKEKRKKCKKKANQLPV